MNVLEYFVIAIDVISIICIILFIFMLGGK